MRQRASHTKSRDGCLNCKQRHLKCDETRPTCLRCFRRGDVCQRPSDQQQRCQSLQVRAYKISTLSDFDLSTFNPSEMAALDYFHSNTLPLLRTSQSSELWNAPALELMRTSTAFRKILTAVGAQQCALQAKAPSKEIDQEVDAMYGNALHSFRRCSTIAYREKSMVLLFGAILLINLEALRGSLDGMLIHASHGTRLALELDKLGDTVEEAEGLAILLQRYCATLQLFCDFAPGHCISEYSKARSSSSSPPDSPGGGGQSDVVKYNQSTRNTTRLFSFLCSSAWTSA